MTDTSYASPLRDRLADSLAHLETALTSPALTDWELAATLERCADELRGISVDMRPVAAEHRIVAFGASVTIGDIR